MNPFARTRPGKRRERRGGATRQRSFQVYNPGTRPLRGSMTGEKTPTVWVPLCCGRVMRFNRFLRQDGGAYGTLVCTACSKNIILEQEQLAAEDTYGEGSRVLNVLGSPKPPKTDRRTGDSPGEADDQTL
jgi:hypothetical protein